MTEYDYSPEGYQHYLETQHRISRWVDDTNAHASEFRVPFGTRSDASSSNDTPTSTSSPRSGSNSRSMSMGREVEERGRRRRNSISSDTLRAGFATERSSAYTSGNRHSYPYGTSTQTGMNPAGRTAAIPGRMATPVPISSSSQRPSQFLAYGTSPAPPPRRTYHHHHHHREPEVPHASASTYVSHGLDRPKRSATLPAAYIITNAPPSQPSAVVPVSSHPTPTHRSHSTHPHTHRSSHRSSHHHHHHSNNNHHRDSLGHEHGHGHRHGHSSLSSPRSQSTPRLSSPSASQMGPIYSNSSGAVIVPSPGYAVVDNRVYVAEPGGYVVIPPKGRKSSVILRA